MLQCTPEDASNALRKAPTLITMAPGLLQQRFDSMLQFLRVAPDELRKALVRGPPVLCSQPATLERNFELLLELPGADRQRMAEVVTGSFIVLCRCVLRSTALMPVMSVHAGNDGNRVECLGPADLHLLVKGRWDYMLKELCIRRLERCAC